MKKRIIELILILLAFFLPGFIWQNQAFSERPDALFHTMIQSILISVPQVFLIVYILILQQSHNNQDTSLTSFGIVKPRFIDLPLSIAVYSGIFILLMVLSAAISLLPKNYTRLIESGFRWNLRDPRLIPIVIVFSIATGYREELFFRSYLLTRCSQFGLHPVPSLILTSLLFSCGHLYQGLAGFLVAMIQGLYFGIIFLKTKNLHCIAIAHGLYNITILLITLFSEYSLPIQ